MKFDIEIPTCREGVFVPVGFGGPEDIVTATVAAERLGYDAVWATDFLTPTPFYGLLPGEVPNWYEPMISLAYCAAKTSRIKLGTGVLMAPFRDPVILAKEAATLDRFANGRLLLGFGLGFARDEYEAIRPRDRKARRGTLLDECIEVLRLLLDPERDRVSYSGAFTEFRDVRFDPKPVQQPLPMYVVGRTPEALERAVRFDLGVMVPAQQARERMDALAATAEALGRDPSRIDVIAEGELCLGRTHEEAVAAYRASRQARFRIEVRGGKLEQIVATQWIGTPAEVADKIAAVARQGVTHFNVLHITGDSMQQRLEQMHLFAEEIMAKAGP